ncbi:hypothetical protein ACXIUS_03835 [Bosea thiooxidans]
MTAPKISLAQQLEAVEFALRRQQSLLNGGKNIRELRPESVARFDADRLDAAVKTLRWMQSHEAEIRKLLEIPAERRALLWKHMGDVAELLDGKAEKPAGEEGQS